MDSLKALDLKNLWHPFTQQTEWAGDLPRSPLVIAKAKGAYLYDARGRKYLDGVSSLWANLHGHRHPAIDRAVKRQLGRAAHTTFLGLTHEPGIRLADELIRLAPKSLSRVFYSDSGSTAVEVALKMAYQSHLQSRAPRRSEFLALKESYHGDTIGSVSVGGIGLFHAKFRPLLFKTHFAPSPHCLRCPYNRRKEETAEGVQTYAYDGENPKPGDARAATGCRWECLGQAEAILKNRRGKIAAAVAEPIVQGASGIRVAPPGYLKGLARLCAKYGVPLIADEVATGFGRTGRLFACEQEDVRPDLMCLAKGISGGYLPLAATLASERIYRTFLGRYDEFKTFFHGHTYTANPLACAAGRASLGLLREKNGLSGVRRKSRELAGLLEELRPLPWVGHLRQAGLMVGIELVKNKSGMEPFAPALRIGKKICDEARNSGLLLRPLGDVIVLMPPLSITAAELAKLVRGVRRAVETVRKKGA
jgi:adenosylmethionine-8-amino-7-oxononanoate aminotransferase